MTRADPGGWTARPATAADAEVAGRILCRSRAEAEATGTMPAGVHTEADSMRHVRDDVLPHREVWLVEADGAAVAMMVLGQEWLDHLYVLAAYFGRGIGSALVELAKVRRPAGFGLWVFATNVPAQRLYERHCLVAVERTDGRDNEEHSPDIRYRWRPGTDQRSTGCVVASWQPDVP